MSEEPQRGQSLSSDQFRLVSLSADVGRALTTQDTLPEMLRGCTEAIVSHLDAAFARVWTLDETGEMLILRASSGQYTHLDGPHGRVPVGQFKIGQIAQDRWPHLTNSVIGDPRVSDQEWAEREGMVAFAGYPLIVGDHLVGVVALFSRQALPSEALSALGAVADQIAMGVARRQADEARQETGNRLAEVLESLGDAFYALDADLRCTYVNRRCEELIGRRREDVLGKRLQESFPEVTHSPSWTKHHRVMAERRPAHFELQSNILDCWLEFSIYPSAGGGLSVFFRDITERKTLEDERERLLRDAQARAERERLLNQINHAIRATLDPDEIQHVAVRELGLCLGADRCYFSVFDLPADSLWIGEDFRRDDLPGIAGHYRLTDLQVNPEDYYPDGQIMRVDDTHSDAWSFPEAVRALMAQLRVRSLIGVPVYENEHLVATLTIAMADAPRIWNPSEMTLVEAIAIQTRAAVDAAMLLTAKQTRLLEEALIGRIGAAIRGSLDPETIQQTAAAIIGETLAADRCFYLTYDIAGSTATVGHDFHRSDLPALAGQYPLSKFHSLLDEVFISGGTVAVPDIRTALSPGVAVQMEVFQHRAVLAVPFFDDGRLVAALWASAADGPRTWTSQEIALIERAATMTRTVLEAARVSRKEHLIAQQLQAALQPTLPETVPGLSVGSFLRPALEEASVGGDFIDLFALDKELYALVIGDVSGKGLAAAQQIALVRNSLRTTLYLTRAPAQAAESLNSIVTSHDLLVGFVTAFVGIYDAGTGQIVYCGCGHEPALIRRADGIIETTRTAGPPLGMDERAVYTDTTLTLAAGDTLLLYTDGLSESGLSRRELLGTEGLIRVFGSLPAADAVQTQAVRLVEEVASLADNIFRDDVAVLLLRRMA